MNADKVVPMPDNSSSHSQTTAIKRRHYVFALRDEVPLAPPGWTVVRHAPECSSSDEPPALVCSPETCVGERCQLRLSDYKSADLVDAVQAMSTIVDDMAGKKRDVKPIRDSLPDETAQRCVATAGGAWLDSDTPQSHYQRCFSLLHDAIRALRHATNARIPNLTIERVWPFYFVLHEDDKGTITPQNLVIVEHGIFPGAQPATPQQLEEAEHWLVAAWDNDPVELYRDFKLGAQNAAHADGDYVEAVLKAAAASELLIKHTSWILTWEANTQPGPSTTPAPTPDLFTKKPAHLIGSVLTAM